jgi:hypothetical protein
MLILAKNLIMRQIFIFLLLLFSGTQGKTQQGHNETLEKQLNDILATDQGIREYLGTKVTEARKDSLSQILGYSREELGKNVFAIMNKIDSLNLLKVEEIIQKHGYPGKSMVGEPANTTVFYVIQHAPSKIPTYFNLIKSAGKKGELPYHYVAMMEDRMLTSEGKLQIYGSQGFTMMVTDAKTGEKKPFSYIMPIRDPKKVNKRRKKAGFKTTVEANAKRMGIEYKPYTQEEIKKITGTDQSKMR